MIRRPPRSTLFPYTPLSRSVPRERSRLIHWPIRRDELHDIGPSAIGSHREPAADDLAQAGQIRRDAVAGLRAAVGHAEADRKSTRLNSSHGYISYAVFCLKK